MTTVTEALSGKGHRDENFPVASRLIAPRYRAPILAFYGFVRAADDVADHPTLSPPEKLALLDRLEATLIGRTDAVLWDIDRPNPALLMQGMWVQFRAA